MFFETLENRQLMSFTVAVNVVDGVLHIDGTKGNDIIEVWEYGPVSNKLAVRFNNAQKAEGYSLKGVKEIVIETGRGDDYIRVFNPDSTKCSVYGGHGNDELHGSLGAEFLDGGLGNDTIFGSGGGDTLIGGRGDDILYGSSADDVLLGGPGIDRAHIHTVDLNNIGDDVEDVQAWIERSREELVEIEPWPGMISRLKLLQDERSATAFVEFEFGSSGYTVTSVRPKQSGNEIRIEVGVAQWQGASFPAVVHQQRRIPLGELPKGQYTFVVVSRGGEELARRSFDRI